MKPIRKLLLPLLFAAMVAAMIFALSLTASADENCPLKGSAINYGDANGDGAVNNLDLTYLAEYLANYDDETGTSTVRLGPKDLGHTFNCRVASEQYVCVERSCTTAGVYYYSCACGECGTETFVWGAATGHDYRGVTTPPTCTTPGYTTHVCTRCYDTYVDSYIPALDHVYENGYCTRCSAPDPYSQGLSFAGNGDGTCDVVGIGSCTDTELKIPSKSPSGNTVTTIRDSAFKGNTTIASVTIPNTVTSIGTNAFNGCTALQNVSFAAGSKCADIGYSAFYGCIKLAGVDFAIDGEYGTIGGYAFYNCSSLGSIWIPDSVTSIGSSAFSGCSSLTSVTIPEGVTSIGNGAFSGCSSLTSVTIPDSVTSINSAFSGCSSLTSVTIPDSVTSIGNYAFYDCSSLTSVTIPDSVTSIGSYTFYNCSSLTSVTIPEGVTSIGSYAFFGCSSLTSITIPDGVTSIRGAAFKGCSKLTSVTWNAINCPAPSAGDQTTIYAIFEGCENLKEVVFGEGVKSIPDKILYNCSRVTSITIPNTVLSIGDYAFSGCDSLTYNDYNGGKYLGNSENPYVVLIKGTATSGIHKNTKIIANNAFYNCSSLTGITIPDSVTWIGGYAFSDCRSLTGITIPDSVTWIGGYAFSDCRSLTRVIFQGTMEQWNAINKGSYYFDHFTVYCTDGNITY